MEIVIETKEVYEVSSVENLCSVDQNSSHVSPRKRFWTLSRLNNEVWALLEPIPFSVWSKNYFLKLEKSNPR